MWNRFKNWKISKGKNLRFCTTVQSGILLISLCLQSGNKNQKRMLYLYYCTKCNNNIPGKKKKKKTDESLYLFRSQSIPHVQAKTAYTPIYFALGLRQLFRSYMIFCNVLLNTFNFVIAFSLALSLSLQMHIHAHALI